MTTITLVLDGITPLLTHSPSAMFAPPKKGKGAKEQPTSEEEAEAGVYRFEDGSFALPGIAFRNSMLVASQAWKRQDKGARGSMQSVLNHIEVPELIPITLRNGKPVKSYIIDRRRVVLQGKNAVIRSRPKFMEWSAKVPFDYDEELLPKPDIIAQILADAGKRVGVGDARPLGPQKRPGLWFGKFVVRQ